MMVNSKKVTKVLNFTPVFFLAPKKTTKFEICSFFEKEGKK